MKIVLIGCGKTGGLIPRIAPTMGHTILKIITSKNKDEIGGLPRPDNDTVAIHFAHANAVIEHVETLIRQGYPVVVGTTGWYHSIDKVDKMCRDLHGFVVYSSNFSYLALLTHIFCRYLGEVSNDTTYRISIHEIHHTAKKDAPSGTALTLASEIISHSKTLKKWTTLPEPDSLTITYEREGDVKGIHIITVSSPFEVLTIKHEVKERDVFARGAVIAAQHTLSLIKEGKLGYGCQRFLDVMYQNGK